MVFHSFAFLFLFLPAVLALAALIGPRGRVPLLLAASLFFYVASSAQSLPVLAVSFALNATVARAIAAPAGAEPERARRRRWLALGITLNVLLLCVVKYLRPLAGLAAKVAGVRWGVPDYALPLGVSFFTLQQVMYLVDLYEGLAPPTTLERHALLLCFFPYISAGPIVRGESFLRQLDDPATPRYDAALARFVMGLAKKLLLADLCARFADPIFARTDPTGLIDGWIGGVAFTLQLYFDFSGYTDMAIAIAEMLGIVLPENFDSPLRAASVIEFWTRWHITLSKFITTYLFTPMMRAVKRPTFAKSMVVLVVAMTIAGIWHGSGWTFAVFGALHGLGLVTNHLWKRRKQKLPRWLSRALLFVFVVVTFVFFRASSVADAAEILAGMAGAHGRGGMHGALSALSRPEQLVCFAAFATSFGAVWLAPNTKTLFKDFHPTARLAIGCAIIAVLSLAMMNGTAPKGFIYRDF